MITGPAVTRVQILEEPHDLGRRAAVEIARGLVGEQDLRVVRQGACDGDALLLAS